jgi:hypothetical protein
MNIIWQPADDIYNGFTISLKSFLSDWKSYESI